MRAAVPAGRVLSMLAAIALVGPARGASETPPCGPARALPAYAHNDYRGARPDVEALERGYVGVEADVFLVDGEFLLAHDRKELRPGFSLESVYLAPLLDRRSRCGRLTSDPRPFLIAIEDKAPTPAGRQALAALLGRYRSLLAGVAGNPIAEFVLVDDAATPESIPAALREVAGLQWRVTSRHPGPPAAIAADYRLLSLDFRKEIRWNGVGDPPAALRKLVPAAVAAARRVPGCRVRVHDVPARGRIWKYLLDAGVDLIGVTDLAEGDDILSRLGS